MSNAPPILSREDHLSHARKFAADGTFCGSLAVAVWVWQHKVDAFLVDSNMSPAFSSFVIVVAALAGIAFAVFAWRAWQRYEAMPAPQPWKP